jgi:hypothetical protein
VGDVVDWELSMRPTFVIASAVLFLWGIGVAEAADPTQLAETAGYLLGNARHCGVPTERVGHAGKVLHDLIVAAAYDRTEEAAADSRIVEIFMASLRGPVDPALQRGGAKFERLERHHRQSGMN